MQAFAEYWIKTEAEEWVIDADLTTGVCSGSAIDKEGDTIEFTEGWAVDEETVKYTTATAGETEYTI